MRENARKLYEMLKRAYTVPPNSLAEIEAIVAACDTCTELAPKQVHFRVREADLIVFNHCLLIDIMYLQSCAGGRQRAVPHIVDAGTRFNAATFLPVPATAVNIWNSFTRIWANTHVGMPSSMLVN